MKRGMKMHNLPDLRLISAWFGTLLSEFIGEIDSLIYALVIFMIVDYFTGVLCSFFNNKLSSYIGFKGICRKTMIFCIVGIANVLDQHIFQTGTLIKSTVIFFYLSNEGLSILENTVNIGVPIPNKMYDILKTLRKK